MHLSSKLAVLFGRRVQLKRRGLFSGRAVKVMEHGPAHLKGWVRGDSVYDVSLRHVPGKLVVACTCPYFDDFGDCKHLWTTVLEADRIGALAKGLGERYLRMEEDPGRRGRGNGRKPVVYRMPVPIPSRRGRST